MSDHLTTEEFVSRLENAQQDGNGINARCPSHEDRRNSLSVTTGDDGRTLVTCHAGCAFNDIVAAVGVKPSQLMPPKEPKAKTTTPSKIVATYEYRDASGVLIYQVVRFEPKDFRQRQQDGNGGWNWSLKGVRPIPYRLPDLHADHQSSVFIVEGEKDADRLAGLGLLATCNSGGAGKWKFTPQELEIFRGREVIILPDNDEPGEKHALQVAESLKDIAGEIRIVPPRGVPAKGDVSDWLNAGGTLEALMALVASTPLWEHETTEPEFKILDCVDLLEQNPTLREPVVEGLFRRGEVVNVIAKSKVGKSWLGYLLGWSVALGFHWLKRFPTHRGKVLLVDNELHPETLAYRIRTVLFALGVRPDSCRGCFDVIALRGQSRDIHAVAPILQSIPHGKYSLVILDAFYRLLPDGTSENDNAQMTAVYNTVDRYGEQTGAAFALIHHATKGGQSDKDVTDVGSGAGAISRAADSHLILRPHEEDDAVVLDARLRSWEPVEPLVLRWNFPVWEPDDQLDPELLKGRRIAHNSDEAKARRLEDKEQRVVNYLESVGTEGATKSAIRDHSGVNAGLGQVLDSLVDAGRIESCTVTVKSNGKPFDGWRVPEAQIFGFEMNKKVDALGHSDNSLGQPSVRV